MKKLIGVLTIAILLVGSVYADNKVKNEKNNESVTTTSIKGVILDKITGEALVGVKVVIIELNEEVYSDLDGNFEFRNITKDNYVIESDLISYEKQNLKINTNNTQDIKIVMANK